VDPLAVARTDRARVLWIL